MHGRILAALLSALLLYIPQSGASAGGPAYEYRFAGPSGQPHSAGSLEEVRAILAQWGPGYEILEVTSERKISDTVTEFTFSAPPPVPVASNGYVSWHSGTGRWSAIYHTLEEAEAALARRAAVYGEPTPTPQYSGITPSGDPYTAYGSLPPLPSRLIIDQTPVMHCSDVKGRGAVAYVTYTRGSVYVPAGQGWQGMPCQPLFSPPWVLSSFTIHRIETREGYYCGYGYQPEWVIQPESCDNTNIVLVERTATCPVEPQEPLQYWIDKHHTGDPQMAKLTQDLEDEVPLSLRDMLTPEAQTAEACVNGKFAARNFSYKLESTRRSLAYQAHFHDLYQRWLEHGKVDEESPEWEACAERREQVELEVGKRVKTKGKVWNASGGRDHRLVDVVAPENSKHPDGKAFDVSGVGKVEEYLAKDGPPTMTVQDWVNQPNDCNVGWGGLFNKTDPPHFYLRNGEQQMEFFALIAALIAGMEPELPPDLHHGEPQWARLLVSGEHVDGDVVYHYTIVNQHPDEELIHVKFGVAYENGGAVPDLAEKPVGTEIMVEPHPTQPGFNEFWAEMPESAWTAPPHWLLDFVKMEYFPRFYLEFWLQSASAHASVGEVQPGDQLEGFSIRLEKADPTYYETGFEASYYYPSKNYFGYPEVLDTTAPELSIAVDKSELMPPNNKLVDINVDIAVTDDYDGQPAIKLVSITSNETLSEDDIQGVAFGTDDREFELRASRSGNNPEGRIYTITYSAEDAFGHVTEQSVVVTVPHDRRR